ncbi:MAG: hypothetical protein R3B72_35140 [Polyangiaceae bacterium]
MSLPAQQILVPFRAPARLARFPVARPLVGRDADVERLIGLVEGGRRLITVLGAPGIGKTSLAIVAASRLSASLRGWFCDLSNQHSEAALRFQVLSVLGESGSGAERVGDALAALGPALVVLDNFEQLVDAAPTVVEWSRVAPEVVFLVTSRERLAVDDEAVVELEPLPLDGEAMALFRERAREVGAPTDDLAAVRAIVEQLDGVPLAIELAAARTRVMSPAALAERLRDGAGVLTLTKRTHERHQTLAAAIAWSWALLSDVEQLALACCSVFAGSFTLAAAERVLAAALGEEVPPVDLVAALRDKSLVFVPREGRLGLLLSIRQFAADELAAAPRAVREAAEREHARVYAEVGRRFTRARLLVARETRGGVHGDVLGDVDNLVAALERLSNADFHDRPPLLAEVASALAFLAAVPPHQGLRALAAAEQAGLADRELATVVRLGVQQALIFDGRFAEGLAVAEEVAADATLPPELRAAAYVRLGIHRREHGDASGAREAHRQAAALIPSSPPSCLLGINTACLGRLACDFREDEEARRVNEQAAVCCEQLGELWLAALARANLAQLEQELGAFEAAERLLERAVERFRVDGEPHYEGFYAAICGGLYTEWQKHDLARHWYAASERPLESVSRPFSGVLLHGGWAALEALAGDGAGGGATALAELEEARRALVRCPGPLAHVIAELQGATVEVALGLASPAKVAAWRERVRGLRAGEGPDGPVVQHNLDARFALRMLERALAETPEATPVLRVLDGGRGFAWSGQAPVDLSRRAALRRLVAAFTEAHATSPGRALDPDALFARGWPGQHIQHDSAATRVRVAIATLRKLGLRPVLLTRDDGYLFDPEAAIEPG